MLTARSSLQGAGLNELLYAIGGNNGRDTPIVEAYNPATNTWASVASLNQKNYGGDTGRYAGSAVAVNGKLYMMGGWTNSPPLPSNTLSVYNPNTNAWSPGPTIPGSGYTACSEAAVIASKIFLLNACNGYSGYVQQLSIFDTVSNSWSTGPNAPRNHNAGLGALLNGKFYVTGGTDGSSYQPQLDVYDPAANAWTTVAGGNMPVNLWSMTGDVINGKWYVVGGSDATTNYKDTLWIYDPAANTWTSGPPAPTARSGATAATINGKLYVGGGSNSTGNLSTLEVFDPNAPPATATPTPTPTATATPTPGPTSTPSQGKLLNISTRLRVLGGDNAMIGGFIITGTRPKTVVVRAIGPSLQALGVQGALADPIIEVHGSSGETLATNDNWKNATTKQEIIESGLAPTSDFESALWGIIYPGPYTVVVQGAGGTGIGLFEVYDLGQGTDSKLANISTRGFVGTGDNAMIGGIILGPTGAGSSRILVRAIGPSLSNFGIQNALADPILELHNGDGTIIAANDNWRDTQSTNIQLTGIPPTSDLESGILQNLAPGAYTAIVRGKNNATGVGLVEAYDLTPTILEQVSKVVSAANGGVVTLPNGSSVSIPAGVLSSDQLVTLSLLASMPNQPPSGILTSVGPALSMSFTSVPSSGIRSQGLIRPRNGQRPLEDSLQFVLNLGSNPVAGVAGSAPLADIVDLTEGDVFLGIPGSLDAATGLAQLSVPIMAVQNAQSITVGQTNINPARFAAPPAPYGGRIWDPTRGWLDFTDGFVPSKKTLILVHGVNSSVETAYGGCINELMAAGGYEQAVGFDYDWTQRPADTGAALAEFLNTLQARGLSQADIEAHSFGTITALAAMTHTNLPIAHAVLQGGPLDGTPLAQSPAMVTLISYNMNGLSTTSIRTLDEFLGTGVLGDLSPGAGVLNDIKNSAIGAHHETSFVRVVGQTCLEMPPLGQRYIFGFNIDATNDCFIPVTSAAGSGLPGPPPLYFNQQHDKLECDPSVIHDVGILVKQPIPTPTPTAAPSIMVSPATLGFSATEGGFAPPNQSFTIKNVGAPGSTLNYMVTKDASWIGLSGPIIPLAPAEFATHAVSANPAGLSAAHSPYTATITVSDPASVNVSQNAIVTFTITAPPSPTPSPTPAATPSPTPSGNKYCINEWHWIYPPGQWDTSKWYGSNTLGQYPFPGSPQCNVYPYIGCVVTYTYDCDSDALPQPCGQPICVP